MKYHLNDDETEFDQKITKITEESGIDASDWYGKTLLLQELMKKLDKNEANKFMYDTIVMLDGEI